ncbi:MAG: amylo-alpha-1,6-glucosidase [Desertifilum sp.]|nr:amylo-alpha-1,6-glucosidase [Desertifilum sp.]
MLQLYHSHNDYDYITIRTLDGMSQRMDTLDTREWLLTNGLGGFASGTISDARSRTYHGWLMAALNPPGDRTLLLSHLEASLEIGERVWALGTNFWQGGEVSPLGYRLLQDFQAYPYPCWQWGEGNWQLKRGLWMPHGWGKGAQNQILIRYTYQGTEAAVLRLRLLIGDRNFHHQQSGDVGMTFTQVPHPQHLDLQAMHKDRPGTPWQLAWSAGEYSVDEFWYWNYYYPEERQRGLGDREDLYSPGYLTVRLQPGESVTLIAQTGNNVKLADFDNAVAAEQQRLENLFAGIQPKIKIAESVWAQLLKASDAFIAYRASIDGPTAIAGYPWFNDWGRDTLIALPGLALATQRYELARGLLDTFGRYCKQGLIPNTFPDADSEPLYNSIDAALWWIETLGLYLEATQDWDFLEQHYPTARQIYKGFTAGTLFHICRDAADGLITWQGSGIAITWMDAVLDGEPITPRQGKPVEINALWYSALCWLSAWAQRLGDTNRAARYQQHAHTVERSLSKFWNRSQGYFYDTIAPDDRPDPRIRPNAIIALSLQHCGFSQQQARSVLQVAQQRLLTPYGLRSLDPQDPAYQGTYIGDRHYRDRAYHQGTVWSWLIGPFVRSWRRFYPNEPLPVDLQPLLDHFQSQACLGSVSEIFDGDSPHSSQGAVAQAWSVAELIRILV